MPNLASIRCGFYRIPLPVMLSDSTHGEMRAFKLNTVRLTDAEGAEGVGYTYTAGRNGAAVHFCHPALVRRAGAEGTRAHQRTTEALAVGGQTI